MPESPIQPVSSREPLELTYAPPKRSLRRRVGAAARSWARSTFSRESLVSSFKSLLWVLPLTVLIWVYAEREQVVVQTVGIALETPAEASRVVSIAGLNGGTVHVELHGPQAGVDQVKEWLESVPVPLDVDHNLAPGPHQIFIEDELNKIQRIKDSGVTVKSPVPSSITINIDPVIDTEVEVRSRPEDAKGLVAPPVFSPARVRVIGPATVLARAKDNAMRTGGQFVAYANLKAFAQQLSEPGKHDLSSVPVSVNIDNPSVTISPVTVNEHIEVASAEQRYTIPTVRILAAVPPSLANADKYKTVLDDQFLHNVVVIGPQAQLDQLRDQVPAAYFEVKYDNIGNPAPAALTFVLPQGVRLADPNQMVNYHLVARSASDQ